MTGRGFDPRELLNPRRLTLAMWDQAFLMRHAPGGSFAEYGRVLDETLERGYNTVRLDPMPQWIDLARPDQVLEWPDPKAPFMPWGWNTAVKGQIGQWLIDFMAEVARRPGLHYTLSAWWFGPHSNPRHHGPPLRGPLNTHADAAELWCDMLRQWERRFGFSQCVYVDLANEVPYFMPGFLDRLKRETGAGWHDGTTFNPQQIKFIAAELNGAIGLMQREFPQLRFTASIHGDLRWLDVPIEWDCLDVHFYADADPRWRSRSRFHEQMPRLFTDDSWHRDFSDRTAKAHAAIAPMLRQRQRAKLGQFAAWATERGAPLTTSESWAAWYMFDSPNLDWKWLLEWSEWSVEDAIDHRMWGWTPHNYVQPQFANWRDVKWHQRLTSRFLNSEG